MATIATLISRMRQDLRDEDSATYRWTDSHLQRHLERAIREYSLAAPREHKSTVATEPGSRDLPLAGLTDLIRVEAVEWPAGQWPPALVPFRAWEGTLTLVVSDTPDGEPATIAWLGLHAVDASTLPAQHEELVTRGAAGYAAIEWASYATNRANTGGAAVAAEYQRWGEDALAEFRSGLERLRRKLHAGALSVNR